MNFLDNHETTKQNMRQPKATILYPHLLKQTFSLLFVSGTSLAFS